jgi:hypothetical protein
LGYICELNPFGESQGFLEIEREFSSFNLLFISLLPRRICSLYFSMWCSFKIKELYSFDSYFFPTSIDTVPTGYLMTFSTSMLQRSDDRMISECGAVGEIRIGGENERIRRNPPQCDFIHHKSYMMTWDSETKLRVALNVNYSADVWKHRALSSILSSCHFGLPSVYCILYFSYAYYKPKFPASKDVRYHLIKSLAILTFC